MSFNSQTREQALEAALRLGTHSNAHDLIREAKQIEAYLEGKEDGGAALGSFGRAWSTDPLADTTGEVQQ